MSQHGEFMYNPTDMPALVTKDFNKVFQYGRALVDLIKQCGGKLLNESGFEAGLTMSVGFPPRLRLQLNITQLPKRFPATDRK